MWKFYPKVLFVYLNDNQGAQDRSVDDCDDFLFFFFLVKKQLASTYSVFTLVSSIMNERMEKKKGDCACNKKSL